MTADVVDQMIAHAVRDFEARAADARRQAARHSAERRHSQGLVWQGRAAAYSEAADALFAIGDRIAGLEPPPASVHPAPDDALGRAIVAGVSRHAADDFACACCGETDAPLIETASGWVCLSHLPKVGALVDCGAS